MRHLKSILGTRRCAIFILSWSNDQQPNQKKKRSNCSKESNLESSFLQDVSLLLAKESASETSQTDKLLQQFLEMQNNEVAMFLKSLQPSLERFLPNRLVYETVKHRINTLLFDAMIEFPQDSHCQINLFF